MRNGWNISIDNRDIASQTRSHGRINHTFTEALAAKPEAEIWRKHVQSISRPWFPIRI